MSDLPSLEPQPILHVDLTPDADLPLRILRAYRHNCDQMWLADPPGEVWDIMNRDQLERAKLLDEAIATLEKARETKA